MAEHRTPEEEARLHERWIRELEELWAPLFAACPDGVYLYIDDEHKTCSPRLAEMLGVSVERFKAAESYLDEFVHEESIDIVIHTYMKHLMEEPKPVTLDYVARRADGSTFPATVFQVPVVHAGEVLAAGFIRLR